MDDLVMPFGKKYKGWRLSQIPDDYLQWVMRDADGASSALKLACQNELDRRNTAAVDGDEFQPTASRSPRKAQAYPHDKEYMCSRCHDTGYFGAYGMKATCNCERGLLHKVCDLETAINEEARKRAVAEAAAQMAEAQLVSEVARRAKSQTTVVDVPKIRSTVSKALCLEILKTARRGYSKNLHPDVLRQTLRAKGIDQASIENDVREATERLMNLNACLDYLEACAEKLKQ